MVVPFLPEGPISISVDGVEGAIESAIEFAKEFQCGEICHFSILI